MISRYSGRLGRSTVWMSRYCQDQPLRKHIPVIPMPTALHAFIYLKMVVGKAARGFGSERSLGLFRLITNVMLMSIKPSLPVDSLILKSDRQVRAYVHPVRMDILKRLSLRELTISGLAREMQVIPANLSRHIKMLLAARLIKQVRTHDTGRNLEKFYRASARTYRVERKELLKDKAATALSILRDGLDDAIARMESEPPAWVRAYLFSLRLNAQAADRFRERLREIASEFETLNQEADGEAFLVSLAAFPSPGASQAIDKVVME
jgi:DNA-binding transcriptional ArsR family regulator